MVTLIDACKYEVKIAPWAVSSDIGMGILCVQHMNDSNALILKNHGVMCFGEDLKEALYSAVYLEEGAKTYVLASLMGKVEELPEEEINKERSGWTSYGQK
jgi:Ribulose-5-phosphate 4-epimerase and related epimerases and aldolases